MCRQAMHEQRIRFGDGHHFCIHNPVGKSFAACIVLTLKAHAGPDIGGNQVGIARRIHRVSKFFIVVFAE